jgi:hypothetical protein
MKAFRVKRISSGSKSVFPLTLLCLGLPFLGGCAAAGLAAAIGGGGDDRSVAAVQAAGSSLDALVSSAVETSPEEIVNAVETPIVQAGNSTSFNDTGSLFVVGYGTTVSSGSTRVDVAFDQSGAATSISINSPVRSLSFSSQQIYSTGGNSITAYDSPFGGPNGPAVSNYLTAAALSYVLFGAWESVDGTLSNNSFSWGTVYRGTAAGGELTSSMPTSGSFNYTGGAVGFLLTSSSYDFVANISANFDLGARTGILSLSNMDAPSGYTYSSPPQWSNYNFSSSMTLSGNSFQGTTTTSGGSPVSVNGNFYGPSAVEIGGNIKFGNDGLGAFGASR